MIKKLAHEIHILGHLLQKDFCTTPENFVDFFKRCFNVPT